MYMKQAIQSLYLWLDSDAAPVNADRENERKIDWLRCIPFIFIHIACFAVFWVGVSSTAIAICAVGYAVRVFALTAFYHRFFSHRAFKTSRFMQFIFAVLGASAAQRGPLWWSSHHRHHHRHSDKLTDKHSPYNHGFWWSHCGWFISNGSFRTDTTHIKDLVRYPELVFINRFDILVPLIYSILLFMWGGWQYVIWGFFVSTVLVYHVTFLINSMCHMFGNRTFKTTDTSRNNLWLALLTFGEGWHNNHHYWPSSARQGFKFYQIDISYYLLKLLEKMGLIWDLRSPPQEVLNAKPEATNARGVEVKHNLSPI